MVNKRTSNQFRIVSGQWRGRKFSFVDAQGLRPTLDRVRETLFNWLQKDIFLANCLDLFSGSGALAFEALSRGASSVTIVDNCAACIAQIKKNLNLLDCQQAQTFNLTADQFLQQTFAEYTSFQLVFLDPPFNKDLLIPTCHQLENSRLLANHCLIYIEAEQQLKLANLPKNWSPLKHKKAGKLSYYLYQREE